ncbi:hypothetical protein HZY97_16245 [Sphingomonas sp. R-74633]|uniref:hypothetical protein n=1 Tax=Sphingomonas sp. R-74633 TaxID=2751188 RepID=UPI0015D19D6B|nr:hypothetical protein [Sphingomonas sp. R-74633]NYT42324.1 hypothetical protein [Sphingomonas sp. R-74633]
MSAAATPMVTSWNGGELSPLMVGRTDTAIYAIGAEAIENFFPIVEGPLVKCPGFKRIRAAALSSSWLIRFVFNTTQAYVLECLDQKLRFYTNGGRIETDVDTPYEVAAPYSAAEWPRVSTQQSYDVLYMAHGAHPPGELRRSDADTFAYDPLELKNGPFKDGNSDEGVTIGVSGTLTVGGDVTLTASGGDVFKAGHVGGIFRLEAKDFSDIPAWQPGIDEQHSGTTYKRSEGHVYLAASNGTTGPIQPVHTEGTMWDGDSGPGKDVNGDGPYGVKWTYLYDSFGVVQITAVTDAQTATATVLRRLPQSLTTAPSWRWAHGAFSTAEGWPQLVFIWASRLCFWKDFTLYRSVVGDYRNFQQWVSNDRLTDDLGDSFTLAASDPPLWVVVDGDVLVGTASAIYPIGRINGGQTLSSVNLEVKRPLRRGSLPVWPAQPDTRTVFVERGGRMLREASYNLGSDRYEGSNISRWARHIGKSGFVQLGQQAVPEELLFGVRGDGQLVLRSYDPEQEIKGFSRRVPGGDGAVVSAVSVPSEDGGRDEIWALCDWGGARSVQQMQQWWVTGESAIEDAFFVDDGLSDSLDVASATVTGLQHLAGTEVAILADGAVCPRQLVPLSGVITLPFAARKRTVGRPYTAYVRTLPIEARDPSGQTAQGKKARVVNLILRLLDTMLVKARVKAEAVAAAYRDEQLLDRPNAATMDAPPPLYTGDTDGRAIGGDWGRDGRFAVVSDDPGPCTVIAGMPRFLVSDR